MIKIENLPENTDGALTLGTYYINNPEKCGGWIVIGQVHEDYYKWINGFVAIKYCEYDGDTCDDMVCGDFEKEIYASSKEAYEDFIKNCPPTAWDYDEN